MNVIPLYAGISVAFFTWEEAVLSTIVENSLMQTNGRVAKTQTYLNGWQGFMRLYWFQTRQMSSYLFNSVEVIEVIISYTPNWGRDKQTGTSHKYGITSIWGMKFDGFG